MSKCFTSSSAKKLQLHHIPIELKLLLVSYILSIYFKWQLCE